MKEQPSRDTATTATTATTRVTPLHPKLQQVLQSRKVWAGTLGLALTLGLWALGEIDAAQTVEAMTWVLSIFIGAVALEDGLSRLLQALGAALAAQNSARSSVAQPIMQPVEVAQEQRHDAPQHHAP